MDESLQPYKQELGRILQTGGWGWPKLTQLLDHLYLGAEDDATNVKNLKELGITHIINCAESYIATGEDFYGKEIKYMGFEGEDDDDYDILQHFEVVTSFIDEARLAGGKVLIHCIMGINRSGALALAYIMMLRNIGPLSAAKVAKEKRKGVLVTNHGFQKRLIQFAQNKGLLEKDKDLLPPKINLD